MRFIAIVVFATLVATPALAQIDWDADNFGVFFDEAGTQTALTTAPGAVTAYLVLLNPTVDAAAVTGWEAGCWSVRQIGADRFPIGGALPLQFMPSAAPSVTPVLCPAQAGPQTLPAGDAVVLGTFEVIVPTTLPYGFYDDMGGGTLGRDGEPDLTLQAATYPISTMPPMLWLAATINSDHVPVPAEDVGWGAVKALYR